MKGMETVPCPVCGAAMQRRTTRVHGLRRLMCMACWRSVPHGLKSANGRLCREVRTSSDETHRQMLFRRLSANARACIDEARAARAPRAAA